MDVIETALASVSSGACAVETTVLKSFLKGKRAKITKSAMCARLQGELNEKAAVEKSALEQGDVAIAEALNMKEYEDEGQAIECACCYSEVKRG